MSAAHKQADRLTTEEYLEGERASEIRHEFVLGRVYPDVLVVGDPADSAKYYRERPTVIFEVLSPDTERTDQREKAMAYFQISSVRLYLIVEQDKPR